MNKGRFFFAGIILLAIAVMGSLFYANVGAYEEEPKLQDNNTINDIAHEVEEDNIIEVLQPPEVVKGVQDISEQEDNNSDVTPKSPAIKEPNSSNRKVFLTFDDGPTSLTPKVLDILNKYDVNATFFTIGRLMEQYPEYVLRTYNEGNMVLPHSYSHDFAIYTDFSSFYEDFYRAEDTYREVLGFDPPPIFRFPGGSSNHSSFEYGGKEFMPQLTENIKEKGYYYIDWNIDSGDTGVDKNNPDKLLANVLRGIEKNDFAIILFHDLAGNKELIEILPEIIETLKTQGYTFKTFRDITEEELDTMVELKLSNKPIIR